MELAEAFLEQQNEGPQPLPTAPDPKDDTIEEGVVTGRPALSIHEKPKGKGKNERAKAGLEAIPRGHPVPSQDQHTLCRQTDIQLQWRVSTTPFTANIMP